jgi:hypothetical protein
MARARSSGGNTLARIDSVDGMTNAAPRPMSARAAMSWVGLVDTVDARDAMATTVRPNCSAPLRPNRSPSAPAGSSRPANTRA